MQEMKEFDLAHNILVFSLFYVGGSCDWVKGSHQKENAAVKTASATKHFAFPRNEYIYSQTSGTIERIPPSTYQTTTKAFPVEDETTEQNTQSSFSPEFIRTPSSFSQDEFEMEDRMDDSEEITPEKSFRTTEKPSEEKGDSWISNESGGKTESFLPFLQKVQDELIVKGRKNLNGKINMLKNLRDDLLLNIDERIGQLWGATTKQPSEARGHKDDDYDMHFPSNEGALMTIGFLTFAVFLIKLVLKLVQALKAKHSMIVVTPTMMTTNAAIIGRRKRDVMFDEHKRLLQLIDEYSLT